jgi:hypothetical protein
MSPFLAQPLESDPVDIVAKLRKIGRTRYTSDRKFHTDVYQAIESLHDGHSIYARRFNTEVRYSRNCAFPSSDCLGSQSDHSPRCCLLHIY